MRIALAAWLALALAPFPGNAQQTTTITVRVVSHDAKIIGSGVGGARVVIRNAATGAVLAEGDQHGGTGDTRVLVVAPRERGVAVHDTPGAGGFTASIALDTPTVVIVTGEGPLGYPHAQQRASKTLLLMPGQSVTGDGVILELHGFIVEVLEPSVPARGEAPVRARVRMLCGCPFTAGGLWDAERMTVVARAYSGHRLVREVPLAFTGEENIWGGVIALDGVPADARLVVEAADAGRVNFGRSQPLAIR